MSRRRTRQTGLHAPTFALLGLLLLTPACGGGGGGGSGSVTPVMHFTCGGVAAASPDQIAMSCPATSGSPLLVSVEIGGPTSSSDIYGIKFDLVFSPAVMTFTPPAIEGAFLSQGGAGTTLVASSPPGDPGRVVVSITRTGGVAGLQATAASTTVVLIGFDATGVAGTTSLAFENAEAVDSGLLSIGSLQFTAAPLTVTFQ